MTIHKILYVDFGMMGDCSCTCK